MNTIPRIIDLKDIAIDTPTDLTCGGVFLVYAVFIHNTHEARIEMVTEEGRGKTFCYREYNISSLKDLAEKLRLAFFEINCDLSWQGRAKITTQTIECEVAHQRNHKTQGNYGIRLWTMDQGEWEV